MSWTVFLPPVVGTAAAEEQLLPTLTLRRKLMVSHSGNRNKTRGSRASLETEWADFVHVVPGVRGGRDKKKRTRRASRGDLYEEYVR